MRSQPFFGELAGQSDVGRVQLDLAINPDEFARTTDSHSLAVLYALAMDAKRRLSGRAAPQVSRRVRRTESRAGMPIRQIFISFKGRIPRSTFWAAHQLSAIPLGFIAFILDVAGVPVAELVGTIALYSLAAWISIVVSAKRLHDIGASAWWSFLLLVPLVNFLVLLFLGLVRGMAGSNKYGDDPLSA